MTDIELLLPQDITDALFGANPTIGAGNVVATIDDLSGFVTGNIYTADGTIGAGRTATLTDTLTFSGGTVIHSATSGSDTLVTGSGTNPIGFTYFGDLAILTGGGVGKSSGYGGWNISKFGSAAFNGNAEWRAETYGTGLDSACVYTGPDILGGGDNRSIMYWINNGRTLSNGLEANATGELLLSQNFTGGLVTTTLTAAHRVLFTDASGYIRATTYADLVTQLAIPSDNIYTADGALTANRTVTGAFDINWNNTGDFRRTGDILFAAGANRLLAVEDRTGVGASYNLTVEAGGGGTAGPNTGGDLILTPGSGGVSGPLIGAQGDIYLTGKSGTDIAKGTDIYIDAGNSAGAKGGNILTSTGDGTGVGGDGGDYKISLGIGTVNDGVFEITGSFGSAFKVDGGTGKVTIPGVLDPIGLQMTARATNPTATGTPTLWANSGDSDRPYWDDANKIAFITDLDGSGIYGPSASLTVDHTTTLGTFDWSIDTDVPATGKLRIGRAGQTAISPIHFFAPDAGGIYFEGFNGSDNNYTARFYNFSRTVESANFQNNGDVVLSPELSVTSRSRVVIGNNGNPWATNVKLSIRGGGSTSGSYVIDARNNSATPGYILRGDNVSLFRTTNDNPIGVGAAGLMAGDYTTTTTTLQSAMQFRILHQPSADGNGRVTAAYFRNLKQNDFDVLASTGLVGEAYNSGTGNYTNASLGLIGVAALSRNIADNVSIPNMIGVDANVQTQSTATNEANITHMASVYARLDQTTNANVTNMYYYRTKAPANIGGANVGDIYGLNLVNTEGLPVTGRHYGVYQAGNNTQNWFQGDVSIGSNIVPGTPLYIQGNSNVDSFTTFRITNLDSQNRYLFQANGQEAYHAGGTASTVASFGSYHQVTGFSTGFARYSRAGVATTMLIQHTGGGANPKGLSVGFQGVPTGTATAIDAVGFGNGITAPNRVVGIHARARDASQEAVAMYAQIVGAWGAFTPNFVAGVQVSAVPNIDTIIYGIDITAAPGISANADTKDKIGIRSIATNNTVASGATSKAVGGEFRTATVGGGGAGRANMALLVPNTNNDGIVVFGADTASANASMVEITGDAEIIGSTVGLILEDRLGSGNRARVYVQEDTPGNFTLYTEPA